MSPVELEEIFVCVLIYTKCAFVSGQHALCIREAECVEPPLLGICPTPWRYLRSGQR